MMDARLVVLEPRTEQWKVVRSPLPATIGRGSDADVQIGDAWVSRRHCQLDQVDVALVVRDLGSRHGTLVNRAYVSEMELTPGDEIMIGTTCLRVTLDTLPLDCDASPSVN